jgi:hypothetical protein
MNDTESTDLVPMQYTGDAPPQKMEVVATDMRALLMSMKPDEQAVVGAAYVESRKAFRDWLRSRLVEGIHFGYPPGTEPKYDTKGNLISRYWSSKKKEYVETKIAPHQWTAKPSLYKAGADFICDLLAVRDEYAADMDGWRQLGEPKAVFVYACRLYSRGNGELLGEGRGVRTVGQKGGDENNAIKMAKKSAKVDAVLNAFGLSDLFTQDIEDAKAPADVPPQRTDAPAPRPRNERNAAPEVTSEQLKVLAAEWKSCVNDNQPFEPAIFSAWCALKLPDAPLTFNPMKPETWTKPQYDTCMRELGL